METKGLEPRSPQFQRGAIANQFSSTSYLKFWLSYSKGFMLHFLIYCVVVTGFEPARRRPHLQWGEPANCSTLPYLFLAITRRVELPIQPWQGCVLNRYTTRPDGIFVRTQFRMSHPAGTDGCWRSLPDSLTKFCLMWATCQIRTDYLLITS